MSRLSILAAITLAALVGCGTEEDGITLYPVKGTVTSNGEPMAGASISFMPDVSNKVSTPGVDSTGPDGNFQIRFKNRSGLSPGKYRVTVTPALASDSSSIPPEFADDPYMAQLGDSTNPAAPQRKEAVGEQSEFDAEVTENAADNIFDFDVKTKAE